MASFFLDFRILLVTTRRKMRRMRADEKRSTIHQMVRIFEIGKN
jgi:hypothetical protein